MSETLHETSVFALRLAGELSRIAGRGNDPKSIPQIRLAEAIQIAIDAATEQLRKDYELCLAGREQDKKELNICARVLDKIASDYEWMKRAEMVQLAGEALCDIGRWRKNKPGEISVNGTAYKGYSSTRPDKP